jgi:hypothetical protein
VLGFEPGAEYCVTSVIISPIGISVWEEIMDRRDKTFDERKQELVDSLSIIRDALHKYEETGETYPLKSVATQLRALIVRDKRSLKNPLLLELAEERKYRLIVYKGDPKLLQRMVNRSPIFLSTGNHLSLVQDRMFCIKTTLAHAMETIHIIIFGEELNLKDAVRLIADTEAAHYDVGRPNTLDDLTVVELGGLPAAYYTIYSLGKIVRDLGFNFIQSLN